MDRDRFPRAKACGECLNPGAVRALDRLGLLPEVLERDPAVLRGWDLGVPGGPVARGRFRPEHGHGLGLPRSVLDRTLLAAARRAGVRVVEGARVVEAIPGRPPRVEVALAERTRISVSAPLVVAADGLRSVVARRTGLVQGPPGIRKASITFRLAGDGKGGAGRGRLQMGEGFTLGLAPVNGAASLWNGTLVVDPSRLGRALAREPEGLLLRLLERSAVDGIRDLRIAEGPWASGPFDRPSRAWGPPGILAVGDAAGYFDPLTGQGIFRALRSAELAAPAVDEALRCPWRSPGILEEYGRALGRAFRPGRALQRTIEAVLSRQALRRAGIGALATLPRILDRLIGVTGDAAPVRSLLLPSTSPPC